MLGAREGAADNVMWYLYGSIVYSQVGKTGT